MFIPPPLGVGRAEKPSFDLPGSVQGLVMASLSPQFSLMF